MGGMLTWFLGTKAGRICATAGAAAVAIAVALLKAFFAGKTAEKAKQDRAAVEAHRTRDKVDDDVSKLGDDDVHRRIDRWVRND